MKGLLQRPGMVLRQQPNLPVINRNNALTKGMILLCTPHSDLNLVDNNVASATNGTWSKGYLRDLYATNSSGYRYWTVPATGVAISIMNVGFFNSAGVGTFGIFTAVGTGGNYIQYATSNFRMYGNGGGFPNAAVSATPATDAPFVHIGIQRSATSREVWLNGVLGGTNTTSNSSVTGATRVGLLYHASGGPSAQVYTRTGRIVAMWNRAISDAEAVAVSNNPWQLLQGPTRIGL